jgi:hypothetical protein
MAYPGSAEILLSLCITLLEIYGYLMKNGMVCPLSRKVLSVTRCEPTEGAYTGINVGMHEVGRAYVAPKD